MTSDTKNTKISIFSLDKDAFPFSQCRKKPYNKKNLTDGGILFNYSLFRKKRVTENPIGIWINRFRIFVNRYNVTPDNFSVVLVAIIVLDHLLRFKPRDSYTLSGLGDLLGLLLHTFCNIY